MVVITEKEKSMKRISKTFTVEITEREAELLSNFLNNEYKEWQKMYKEEPSEAIYNNINMCRELRNGFAELVNKHYMGVDA